jgi:hypothetical protein
VEKEQMGLDQGSDDQRESLATDMIDWFETSQQSWIEFGPVRR